MKEDAVTLIKSIVAHHSGREMDAIGLDTKMADLDLDSLHVMSIIYDVECTFDMDVDSDRLRSFACVGDIVDAVH